MDPAREEGVDKHAASIDVDVDEGVLGGTVAAAAGTAAPAPATVAAVVNPVAEDEEDVLVFDSQEDLFKHMRARRNLKEVLAAAPKLQLVAVVPKGSCVLPGIDGADVESEADPLQDLMAEKVTAADVVTPLKLQVVEVPEGSCVLPCKDGEDAASDADLRQIVTAEKVTVTAAVAPLQLPVDGVPEDSCLLPGNDGEDIKQKQVAEVESPPPDVATSNKRKYGAGGWLSFEDEGYSSLEDDEYEYNSGDEVDEGNAKSFGKHIKKRLDDGDLKIGGVIRNGREWFTCPFCPGKPADGLWKTLTVHGQSASLWGGNKMVRVQHDVLAESMCGVNRPNVAWRSDKKRKF